MVANAERALAIELLAGAQAVEFLAPLEPGVGVRAARVRPHALGARRGPTALRDIERWRAIRDGACSPPSRRSSERSRERPAAAEASDRSAILRGAGRDPVVAACRAGSRRRLPSRRVLRPRNRMELVRFAARDASSASGSRSSVTTTSSSGSSAICRVELRAGELNARSWQTEAPLRMLLNNLDREVAEHPESLVVYGGSGKAARISRRAARASSARCCALGDDETLLVQTGKPVGVFRTHAEAPRVLIANSLLVPRVGDLGRIPSARGGGPDDVRPDDRRLLDLHRHPGDPPGDVPDVRAAGEKHFGSPDLAGRTVLTAGLGGMGGAQPLAATMAGAAILCIEVDQRSIERRLETRYLDEEADSLDDALARVRAAAAAADARFRSRFGKRGRIVPELARARRDFDLVTDQTAAHDPLTGYVPAGVSFEEAAALRARDPDEYLRLALGVDRRARPRRMLEFVRMGCYVFDYGNNLRGEAYRAGLSDAFTYPGFVPAYIRPLFCRGIGPFRWAALSGDPGRHRRDRPGAEGAVSRTTCSCSAGSQLAPERVAFQGLPARICWLGYGDRARGGPRDQRARRVRDVEAPIVIGRDHLDSGSVASPYRETEAMRDGSDAIADWPILNALLNTAAGATWVSVHHGGGVGIGNSIHAGMVVVADGTARPRSGSSGC